MSIKTFNSISKALNLNSNIYELDKKKKKLYLINIYTDDPFNFNSSATIIKECYL